MQVSESTLNATDVADRLHSTAIHVLRRVRAEDVASGLSPARLSALSVVVFGGPVTLGQLAQAEQVSAPTMTRLVAGLEEDGLVERGDDEGDRRVVWIRATKRGVRLLEEGRRRRVAALGRALSTLSRAELSVLNEALDLIRRALGASPPGAAARAR